VAEILESSGLLKEAVYVDAISNSIEKVAMMGLLKNLVSKIPGLSSLRTKEDAMAVITDAVQKIGANKIIEAIEFVQRIISQNPQPGAEVREAAAEESISQFIRVFKYPIVVGAIILLFYLLGKPAIDNLKNKMQHIQQDQTAQIDQVLNPQ